jgi:prepilin-type processing-associated H-X9-DG protein
MFSYLERTSFYEQLTFNGPNWSPNGVNLLNVLRKEGVEAVASMPIYLCPTRRSGLALVQEPGTTATNCWWNGPRSDYAVVNTGPHLTAIDWSGWGPSVFGYIHANPAGGGTNGYEKFIEGVSKGPLRASLATFSGNQDTRAAVLSWVPRDTFTWWSDGSSNQIVIGEKHIPSDYLNNNVSAVTSNGKFAPDGNYLITNWGNEEYYVARFIHKDKCLLARGPNDYNGQPIPGDVYGFGSYHSGVCNFLFGDGSVRGLSVTIQGNALHCLATVDDGETVSSY